MVPHFGPAGRGIELVLRSGYVDAGTIQRLCEDVVATAGPTHARWEGREEGRQRLRLSVDSSEEGEGGVAHSDAELTSLLSSLYDALERQGMLLR